MKPIYLKMTAFGPYKTVEEIRFEELKDHRLFVISGPTGAGKTTIFDAICFAIYGTSSGSDRDNVRMLRSDFAADDLHTSVELVFEIHSRTYRVFRQLGHVKKGRKTSTGEKYELYEVAKDGTENPIVERQIVTEVNRKLEEIVGLTYDQFSQIVMLPQGEFRKLLTSQSENKEAILRKIFKTDRYGKMVKVLEQKKQQADADARHVKVLRDSYIEQIAGALPQRESNLFTLLDGHANVYQIQDALAEEQVYYEESKLHLIEEFKRAQKTFNEANEQYIAAKTINDQLDALQLAKVQLEQMEKDSAHFEQLKLQAEAAQRANTLVFLDEQCLDLKNKQTAKEEALTNARKQLQLAENQLEAAKVRLDAEKENEPKRKQLVEKLHQLQSMKPVYEQVDAVVQRLKYVENEAKQSAGTYQQINAQVNQLKQEMKALNGQMQELEDRVSKHPAILERLHKVQSVYQLLQQLKEKEQQLAIAQVNYSKEDAAYSKMKEQYQAVEKMWLGNQAYILASSLHDGDACPVCGSLDHPNKEQAHSSTVTEEILEDSKQQLERAEQLRHEKEVDYKLLLASTEQLKEQLIARDATIEQFTEYEEELQQLSAQNIALQQQAQELTKLKKADKEAQEKLQLLEESLKQTELTKNQFEKEVIELSAKYAQMQANMDATIQNLAALNHQIESTNQTIQQSEKAWQEAQTFMQQAETTLATANQTVLLTEQQLEEIKQQLLTAKEQFMEKLRKSQFETYKQYRAAILPEEQIQQLFDQHLTFSKQLHALQEKVREESERLKNNQKVDLTDALAMLQTLKEEEEQLFEQYKLAEKCEVQCQEFSKKLGEVAEEIHRLEEVSNQITDVYNLLKGQNAKKISFERYVQIGYLEQITEAANERLKVLSNGQFMLICSDRQESHGRQSGLSLDVYDSYTGQTRDVKTLSGGEKFNASLSLALGMADIIQSYQGNVRIDTMFIDEGFGSLDEESLMRAIDTLIELQNAGRMIGVISHVAELKNTIPAVLHVMKAKEGYSTTKFIVS